MFLNLVIFLLCLSAASLCSKANSFQRCSFLIVMCCKRAMHLGCFTSTVNGTRHVDGKKQQIGEFVEKKTEIRGGL